MIPELSAALDSAQRVLIVSHLLPDGDALGSSLGLAHMLAARGKEVKLYSAGPIPEEYGFLPGLDQVKNDLPDASWVELAVLLDCHQPERTGDKSGPYLAKLPRVAVIDHHQGEASIGQAVWVDPGYAATSEMLAELAHEQSWEMSPEAATCLFVGVQTDTGSFRYSNTSPRCFRAAARLSEAGAEVWAISQEVYATRPKRLRILGRIMDSLELSQQGRLAMSQITLTELNRVEGGPADLEQAVETLRLIPGVEVSALLRETPSGAIKVSMRSRGKVDVSSVAIALGGGGHKNAAGVTLEGNLAGVRRQILGLLQKGLEQDA
ncbi:MAG: bifunctional oligoribonuclease/PAP phosphatase NrnA [Desulfarculaceae bacterium]|nr:bifunctional oligoribonuclease/PAP phosphatase NrnA [Desulfarculaceae bacterium]MCF8071048.1 bifunctional oligoribonuclease/PAP phosphatase NrnA [Desulfarculaceae bacterium]MCF8100636.1 bifunctional oligoribonuclease/PAP phosphatase NrnA [Desulfarculaceae bacterium]MCF8116930.1 bifunctional oligoribonuclease/PAP phosphatase NrnA [Desulfarculaceae bacterium]